MLGLKKKNKSSLLSILPEVRGKYLCNEMMSKHTWFGVGGPAEVMYYPEDDDDLSWFLKAKPYNLPICIIGGGSNLLVRDGGIPGVVIKLDSKFYKKWQISEGEITCGAGMRNSQLKKILLENKLGGLEFLTSIPGHLGGAVRTNAGCFGKELKDVLIGATIINGNGEVKNIPAKDLSLSYRHSLFPDDWIITSLTLKVNAQEPEITQKILDEYKQYRMNTQPHNVKTAGSTFKNPEGLRAWELIKKSGCAELEINGAKVSDKHCNFLVNTGNATAADIENLGEEIIKKVKENTSITLEWEVKKMGIAK
ncbi:MAG: UDP-N-acetylmuramate dehydrogenase [Alphaproteobacteria bacterium]|nr:UDP-N-acetylmuramate dehydrogenase [Alphaproteobacteria bacterium]